MAEYIDVTPFIRDLINMKQTNDMISIDEIIKALKDAPVVNLVEVIHGEWVEVISDDKEDYPYHICSQCKHRATFDYIYENNYETGNYGDYICQIDVGIREHLAKNCPHCGAKMDKGNYNGIVYQTQKVSKKEINNSN